MKAFYVNLLGFRRHEIDNAGGKSFHFTELICEKANEYGFILRVMIEKKSGRGRSFKTTEQLHSISSIRHSLYVSRNTHFSFSAHDPIFVPPGSRLFVQLIPAVTASECIVKLHCQVT